MGCTFCAWWARWFGLDPTPDHDCFYDRLDKEGTAR